VVRWLWDGRLAYRKLNVIGGPPGVGKSYLTLAIAAAVSTGDGLPGDPRHGQGPRRVLLLSFEDDPEDTLRPRLERLGADLDRVEIIDGVEDDDGRRAFGPADVSLLTAHAEQAGDVGLVIVDPVSAFVGAGVDEYRANEVRAALEELRVQAQHHGFAVLIVMHTRKSSADTALNRLAGSQAYGALVRSALMAGPIPDDPDERRALAHVKHNLSAKQATLAYSVDDQGVWWHGEIDLDAEEVAGHTDGTDRSASDEAAEFLADLLADGPVPAKEVYREAEDAGIKDRTLERAKARLHVASRRRGDRWSWELPSNPRTPSSPAVTPGDHGDLGGADGP
jgi:putative DNA primase/helicase